MALRKNHYQTFIFDLDGTLLDTLPDLVVVTNKALEELGFPPRTKNEIHRFVGNGVKALMYQAVPDGTDPDTADEALKRWKELYPVYGSALTKPYPGIPQVLRQLKAEGGKLAVLSNKFDEGVRQIIEQCLPGLFDVTHGEGDGFPRKPDPTGLLVTIRELNAHPDTTMYIGDSPTTDILTAKNADVASVGATWGYHTKDSLAAFHPDLLIDRPEELLPYAKR